MRVVIVAAAVVASLGCRSSSETPKAEPTVAAAREDATAAPLVPSGPRMEVDEPTPQELSTNGYLIDVSNVQADHADRWRSHAWILANVSWGTRDRLAEVANAVAAATPEGSAWITYRHGEEVVLLTLAKGTAKLGAAGGIAAQLAATYRLDAAAAEKAQGSLLKYEDPGMELARGSVTAGKRFDSALLKTGALAGVEVGAFRVEGRRYLKPADQATLQAQAKATDSSLSATLERAYLKVKATYLDGAPLPEREHEQSRGVFMSLAPWFAYELSTTADELERSHGWLIERIIRRAFP